MRMLRRTSRTCLALTAVATAAGMWMAACSGGGGSGGDGTLGSIFAGRPRVQYSVAESYGGLGVEQLNFFDAVEKRDIVTHDDALHGALLLFTGQSGSTFSQRASRAKQMGLVDVKYDPPPREAITAGEFAMILAAGMKLPEAGTESGAVVALKRARVYPEFVGENAGLSGAQLLTVLGHAEDAMASGSAAWQTDDEGEGNVLRPMTARELERVDVGVWSAQPAGQPKKPVRPAPIDLEESARKPRPGQVVPGGTAPAPAEPEDVPDAARPSTPTPDPSTAPGKAPERSTPAA